MFPRRILVVGLVALLALGLFTAINSTLQRDAWLQGYVIGRLSAGTEGGNAAPLPPAFNPGYAGGYGYGQYGPHFGGFFGFLFGIGLLFLVFGVLGRLFRCWAFQQRGGPWGGPGGGPWGRHGHRPPWWGPEQAPESGPDQPTKGDRPEGGSFYA